MIVAAATCSSSDTAVACPPAGDSNAGRLFAQARSQTGFALLYPCDLPAGQTLASVAVTGERGRQKAELIFSGPFELAVRQSQYPPAVNPDPSGASRILIDLLPNLRAELIEKNDGSSKALYHLFWERNGLFYEVQALGPPLQRRQILLVATSLQ